MNIWVFIFIVNIAILIPKSNGYNFELNKVIIHNPSFAKNTHFGFTVAGYKYDNDTWILVGAPLTFRERQHGQYMKTREGAIYRCKINNPNSCYMLPFDKKDWNEVKDHFGFYYNENKTDQLLGATLLASDDVILACAPNYRYVTRIIRQDEFRNEPTGMCFTLKDKMRKFEELSPCKNAMWGHHRLGYCQAGFSGAISKNDSSLYLSGPGAWYWQGILFSMNLNNKEIRGKYPEKSGEGNKDDSYRGYSIDLGHFDGDFNEDIVVSSPRANNCNGYVEIFSSNFKLINIIHGSQIGSYFGYSVIAVDLNNDRLTDIVVSSPMFKKDTENYDVGRIDVFIRDITNKKSKDNLLFNRKSIIGFKARSRFGNTLAKLGDVNDDGYNDIAVGSPYDGEDFSGIVYIFHGSANGLNDIPTQIIKGSEYGLKTFGFSISGGLDLDHNKYPDLIVGAYKSDAAVYIRSKPVIKTSIVTQTYPKVVDFESRDSFCDKNKTRICIDFEYCIQYYGKAIPTSIRMMISLELDIDKIYNKSLIRAYFTDSKQFISLQNFTFKHNQKKCFKQSIFIKKTIRDKLNPIRARLNLTLPEYEFEWELLPIFNSKEEYSKIHQINFLRNCGSDDICTPNLQVTASTPSKKYVYGSRYNIDLNIQVENSKEDAFEAQCHIFLPYGVDYVKAFLSQNGLSQQQSLPCSQLKSSNETKIICDIGNPMIARSMKSFTIRVSPQNIMLNLELLKFTVLATSSNKEDKSTLFDNEQYVYVVLDAVPGIALIGKQYQEQVIYDSKLIDSSSDFNLIHNESEIGPEIMHEYKIINKGPSQILSSELLITWQRHIKVDSTFKEYLYLIDAPYTEGQMKCSFDHQSLVNPLNLSVLYKDKLKHPENYYMDHDSNRLKRDLKEKDKFDYIAKPDERSVYSFGENIDCQKAMIKINNNLNEKIFQTTKYLKMVQSPVYDFYCASIHCKLSQLNVDESSLVRLRFRLWSKSLSSNPDIYHVKTYAMSAVTDTVYSKVNLNLDQFQSKIQIETIAHPKERRQLFQNIDLKIIIMSIIVGILLLIVLVFILWRCGFFKRFEPHELKKINESTSDEEISSSNDIVDVSKECFIINNGNNNHSNNNNNNNSTKSLMHISKNDDIILLQNQKSENVNLLSAEHHHTQSNNYSIKKNKNNLFLLPTYDHAIDSNVYTSKINDIPINILSNSKEIENNSSSLIYLNNDNQNNNGTIAIYSSPKLKNKNKLKVQSTNDEIYGFTNEYQSSGNNLSTFQYSSSNINNKKSLNDQQMHQAPQLHQATIQDVSSLLNNTKQPILNNNSETFTSKLPPVPKRNNNIKTTTNSSYGSLPKNHPHYNLSIDQSNLNTSSIKRYNHKI